MNLKTISLIVMLSAIVGCEAQTSDPEWPNDERYEIEIGDGVRWGAAELESIHRGIMKNTIKLAYNPNKTQRDELYKKGINPVITQAGQGTLLFGDKTMLSKPSAFDRINVRRLYFS